jgi:hypothetical protein
MKLIFTIILSNVRKMEHMKIINPYHYKYIFFLVSIQVHNRISCLLLYASQVGINSVGCNFKKS